MISANWSHYLNENTGSWNLQNPLAAQSVGCRILTFGSRSILPHGVLDQFWHEMKS